MAGEEKKWLQAYAAPTVTVVMPAIHARRLRSLFAAVDAVSPRQYSTVAAGNCASQRHHDCGPATLGTGAGGVGAGSAMGGGGSGAKAAAGASSGSMGCESSILVQGRTCP